MQVKQVGANSDKHVLFLHKTSYRYSRCTDDDASVLVTVCIHSPDLHVLCLCDKSHAYLIHRYWKGI